MIRETEKVDFWLVSFKYAPGNWQHMASFTARAEESGCNVRLLLSERYFWMTGAFSDRAKYVTRSDSVLSILLDTILFFLYRWIGLSQQLRREQPKTIILVMWHPLNAVFCFLAKVVASSRTVVWLHEPYKDDKHVFGAKSIIFSLVEWTQSLAMPWIDDIVLHSEKALEAFLKRYPRSGPTARLIPLQFRDQPGQQQERRLVSFLGKAAEAKGIDAFFEVVEVSASRKLELEFGIATPDDVSEHLAKMAPTARKHLEVVYNPNLSDAALRDMAGRSYAVLCPYKSILQSGVVPIAYMCGTPVIATDIAGLRESVDHKQTGYLIPCPARSEAIFGALTYIKENFSRLSENCRQKFVTTHDDRNWKTAYGWLYEFVRAEKNSPHLESKRTLAPTGKR